MVTRVQNPIPASPLLIFRGGYGQNPMDYNVLSEQLPGMDLGAIIDQKRNRRSVSSGYMMALESNFNLLGLGNLFQLDFS
jgi:hypothetical protein